MPGKAGRTAIVVEGGAMRGIFAAGILDAFYDAGFDPFDLYIGVSAGAVNLAAWLAGMPRRNLRVYTEYSTQKEFISVRKYLRGGHLVDLDWLWDVTVRDLRIDRDRLMAGQKDFRVGMTDVETGEKVYRKPDKDNVEEMIKASSALPKLYRSFVTLEGRRYVDGGLTDPIPAETAWEAGADRILVLRSQKREYIKKEVPSRRATHFLFRKFPALGEAVIRRPERYAASIGFMRNPPEGVKVWEVNPPEDFRTERLTKDTAILRADYQKGLEAGKAIMEGWALWVKD